MKILKKNKYKVIIVGLGNIGMNYDLYKENDNLILTHAKSFFLNKNFEIIAGVDKDKQNSNNFSKKYKIKVFNNLEDAVNFSLPDVIVISTNTSTHNLFLEKIVNLKLSNILILCEKPISNNTNKSIQILENHKNLNNLVFVNYMRRSDPGVNEIKEKFKLKKISSPYRGVCFYTGGVYNNGSHLIDLMSYWFGEIKSYKLISRSIDKKNRDPEIDFQIQFDNCNVDFISLKSVNFSLLTAEIFGSNAKIYYENEGRSVRFFKSVNCPNYDGYCILEEDGLVIRNEMNISQLNVTNEILKALKGDKHNLCPSNRAISYVQLIDNLLNIK